jgi:hypothetical protein
MRGIGYAILAKILTLSLHDHALHDYDSVKSYALMLEVGWN